MTEPVPFDLDARPRFMQDFLTPDGGAGTPPIVDMGAYEYGRVEDLDFDGDVDGLDFMTFSGCFNGSLRPPKADCANMYADFQSDDDVDGLDFMTFSSCFNGSLRPPKCP